MVTLAYSQTEITDLSHSKQQQYDPATLMITLGEGLSRDKLSISMFKAVVINKSIWRQQYKQH